MPALRHAAWRGAGLVPALRRRSAHAPRRYPAVAATGNRAGGRDRAFAGGAHRRAGVANGLERPGKHGRRNAYGDSTDGGGNAGGDQPRARRGSRRRNGRAHNKHAGDDGAGNERHHHLPRGSERRHDRSGRERRHDGSGWERRHDGSGWERRRLREHRRLDRRCGHGQRCGEIDQHELRGQLNDNHGDDRRDDGETPKKPAGKANPGI